MYISYSRKKLKHITFFLIGICATSNSAIVNAEWSIKGLGNLGGAESFVTAINDSGQITGNFLKEYNYHGFISSNYGTDITDIGFLGGSGSFAQAINNIGQVAGESLHFGSIFFDTFITGPNGKPINVVGDKGFNGNVYDINDSGQIVGDFYSISIGGGFHAFITGSNGTGISDLGTLGGVYSSATGINNSGQSCGHCGRTQRYLLSQRLHYRV